MWTSDKRPATFTEYGSFKVLELLDKLELSIGDVKKVKNFLMISNKLFSCAKNIPDRKFKIWCLKNMRIEMLEKLKNISFDNATMHDYMCNFVHAKYRILFAPVRKRPKT